MFPLGRKVTISLYPSSSYPTRVSVKSLADFFLFWRKKMNQDSTLSIHILPTTLCSHLQMDRFVHISAWSRSRGGVMIRIPSPQEPSSLNPPQIPSLSLFSVQLWKMRLGIGVTSWGIAFSRQCCGIVALYLFIKGSGLEIALRLLWICLKRIC